jgi:hypothetical protein
MGGLFNNNLNNNMFMMNCNAVINPKIEIIHPKFVYNHLIVQDERS